MHQKSEHALGFTCSSPMVGVLCATDFKA
jgi:hypothetical protein